MDVCTEVKMKTKEGKIETVSLGIVGGGNAGVQMLQIFSKSQSLDLRFVVDLNPEAPAMVLAKRMGIKTYTDIDKAIKSESIDYLVEVTGSDKVFEILNQKASKDTFVINCKANKLLYHLKMDEQHIVSEVVEDITEVKSRIKSSLSSIGKSLNGIKRVSVDLSTLAINARIEAARAGQSGKGFAVVANEVKNSAQYSSEMIEEISNISDGILDVSTKIDDSLKKLSF
ncbi:MAG: methyl-accepting chemotaxis protein [Vulcanimicrobiota bacterium]